MVSVHFKKLVQVVCIVVSQLHHTVVCTAVSYSPHQSIYDDSHEFVCPFVSSSHKCRGTMDSWLFIVQKILVFQATGFITLHRSLSKSFQF